MADHAELIDRLMAYGERTNDGRNNGTLFRFEKGARFFLSDEDADGLRTQPAGVKVRIKRAVEQYLEQQTQAHAQTEAGHAGYVAGGSYFSTLDNLADFVAYALEPAALSKHEAVDGEPQTLVYTNWRGETAAREIVPKRLWFGSTEWHPEPQWFITAADTGKGVQRDFALSGFASPVPAEPSARPTGHVEIAHDGFSGDIIGHYVTREGKHGVVVQQDGTRVVHVYGEKWLAPAPPLGGRHDILDRR